MGAIIVSFDHPIHYMQISRVRDKLTADKPGSLTRSTLLNMAVRVAVVVALSAGISYLHIVHNLEFQAQEQLRQYISERGQKESSLFLLAEANHASFEADFLSRLEAMDDRDPIDRFNQLTEDHQDGTRRLQRKFYEGDLATGSFMSKNMTGVLGRNVDITDPSIHRRVVLSYDMLSAYGPAWNNRFFNLYTSTPRENLVLVYSTGTPCGLEAPPDLNMTGEEWYFIADEAHNLSRKTVLTCITYDQVLNEFFVTFSKTIYIDWRHILSVGNDISIQELTNRTLEERLPGTYNIVFRGDGQLVAHPQLMEKIKQNLGQLNISESDNAQLKQIFQLVKAADPQQTVLDDRESDEYLAVTKINGPDWYFVTVYPKSLLSGQALDAARFILISGLLALLVEVGLLFTVLRQKIARPLKNLLTATQQVSAGNFVVQLDTVRNDELGQLANAFTKMATQLQESFTTLEQRVADRTAELKVAKESADSANHAKSNFLANMSHELRTPLNGILGYAQVLLRDKTASPKQKDSFNVIYQCGSHLLTLINDVLDLSKIEAGKLEVISTDFYVETFLSGIVELCRIRAEQKEIAFTFEACNKLPAALHGDEKRLRQVLINLLGNAIKFTDQGGVTLKVGTVAHSLDPNASIAPLPARSSIRIRFQVEDTGVGMTPEQLEKIFLPFEQVGEKQRMVEGTGLGLAISTQIVELMGGELQVESIHGEGTTFWFEVELLEAKDWVNPPLEPTAQEITGYAGDRQTVLVVDDRWENRSVLINLLEPIGFILTEAENGQDALQQCQNQLPDLIVTDVAMPVMDGLEFVRQLRRQTKYAAVPVIVSSASVFDFDRQRSHEAGGSDFLPKPVQAEDLFDQIQQQLQLVWHYSKANLEVVKSEAIASPPAFVIPPAEKLKALYAAARIGDIRGIEKEAHALESLDLKYRPFVQPILKLAEALDNRAVLKLLKPYLATSELNHV
ncbi:MAG: ATP-binding protein [Phormidesmis sp.]